MVDSVIATTSLINESNGSSSHCFFSNVLTKQTSSPVGINVEAEGNTHSLSIIGASVSEPHTSEFYCNFSYIYISLLLLLLFSFVRRSVYA